MSGVRQRVAAVPRLLAVAMAAAVVPVVVALVRGLQRGWYPVGDNAYFSIRARDVLTSNHPLLGTWTSASQSVGHDLNNPGPLLFDLFAIPAKIAPIGGIAVAAAILNVGCIVAMALVARRRGGIERAVGVLAVAAGLAWTMGSELLFDPWQPHSLLFPFLLYLVLAWSLAEGDVAMLPLAVGVGSLLVQTHLTYAGLVLGLGGFGIAMVGARSLRDRSSMERAPIDHTRRRRALALATVVAVACWAQPIAEQLTASDGNISRVVRSVGAGDAPRLGVGTAGQMVADVAVVPPAWLRPSFEDAFVQERDPADRGVHILGLPSRAISAASLGAAMLALLATAYRAHRQRDPGGVWGSAVAALAIALALLTLVPIPVGPSGFGQHQVRWLWPVALFGWLVVVLPWVRGRRWTPLVLTLVTVFLGVVALPTHRQVAGPQSDADAVSVLRDVSRQLDRAEVQGPVLFAEADLVRMSIYEPYSTALMLELDRRGIDVVVDESGQARQLGGDRWHPERARARMVLLQGDRADDTPRGGRRVASTRGLDARERLELDGVVQELTVELESRRLTLTDEGRALAQRGAFVGIEGDGSVDGSMALDFRTLLYALEVHAIDETDPSLEALQRYAELQRRWDRQTLSVYLVPVSRSAVEVDG